MSKYKIVVYAISKNEEKFVDRWFDSMKEADDIYVLDTGSTDNTVNKLKQKGVNVTIKEIKPWRFDVARNASLELVPEEADICICTDLDEIFLPGWRQALEDSWQENTTRARYNYNWSLDDEGKPLVNFYANKVHKRKDYHWTHPVHEVLTYTGNDEEHFVTIDQITLNHYPDQTKSRGSYLPLLELSIAEDPTDDRNMHYLGREYMYYGQWDKCIDTLTKHLNLPSATWKDERAASMRFIARSYKNLGRIEESKMWLNKAIEEAPYLRDAFVERALLEYQLGHYIEVEDYCKQALRITDHQKTYINEVFSWDHTIYDLLSISLFYQNRLKESLLYSNMALEMNPNDPRLIKNNHIIKKKINEAVMKLNN